MSILIEGMQMPETEYMDVRIFRDGTATIATGTKPYCRELKAEPVRHGKWMKCDEDKWEHIYALRCSECHGGYHLSNETTTAWNYCPQCGARMYERKEE